MRFAVFAALMAACTPEVPESAAPPPESGCVSLDAGFQGSVAVQGHALPPADIFGQLCWEQNGEVRTFAGKPLETPLEEGEDWSFLFFAYSEDTTYSIASLRGAVEYNEPTYEIVGCSIELPLTASSSYRIDCDMQFNPETGEADITVGNTTIEAQAQWL